MRVFVTFLLASSLIFFSCKNEESSEVVVQGQSVDWESEYAEYLNGGVEAFRIYVEAWYEGGLQNIFYSNIKDDTIKAQVTSILAGHVWGTDNPMILKSAQMIDSLKKLVAMS